MHEIKIYGEIVPFEEQWIIDQGGFYNLSALQQSLKEAKGKDIKVRIRSFGGDVETGFTMYNELRRYAKDNKAKVTTLGEGQVASIATVIFLAGDERILTGHTEPFVHNAWTYSEGDSKTLVRVAAELEKCNNMIADHYALHTDLTRDEALELMNNDTSITAEEAVTIRFATSIEEVLRPVALKRFSTKNLVSMGDVDFIDMMIPHHEAAIKMANDFDGKIKNEELKKIIENIKTSQAKEIEQMKKIKEESTNTNNNKMNKKTQTLYNKVAKFLGQFSNKVVTTADGKELDFYELEDDAVIAVGDKAYFDGMDADGSFIMPDGETYVLVAGELTEIKNAEDKKMDSEALAEANATIALLTEQLEAVSNKAVELDAQNKANIALIAGYKASSKPAPNASKPNPAPTTPVQEPSKASAAVANLNKNVIKK